MIVNINGEVVVLDGKITIEKSNTGEYKLSSPTAAVEVTAGSSKHIVNVVSDWGTKQVAPEPDIDPKYYKTSTNRMSVNESVNRAVNRIMGEIWREFSYELVLGAGTELTESVNKLVVEGKGRDTAYAIAGNIKKGMLEGQYKGVPMTYIFKGIVDGSIKQPEKVEAKPYRQKNSVWNYR